MAHYVRLIKKFHFDAAHSLPHYDGKCVNLHGHSWAVELTVEGYVIGVADHPKKGMLIDFGDLKFLWMEYIDDVLDHKCLNDIDGLDNPTAENIAKWIYDKLYYEAGLEKLTSVKVWESPDACAEYTKLFSAR